MNKFEKLIKNIEFKKAVKVYLVTSILLLAVCASAIFYVSRDKIYMIIGYERVHHTFNAQGLGDNLKLQLNKLAEDSKDISNAVVLDKHNNIIYKINNNIVGENKSFQLSPYDRSKDYFQDNINGNIIYKAVREDNILLNQGYIKNDRIVENDFSSDFFYEDNLASKEIYQINFIIDRHSDDRIFIIRHVNPIPYAETLFEITGIILGAIFIIYWLGLVMWVYRDASEKKNNPSLWGIIVLITNIVGLVVYMIYKQSNKICPECNALQSKENKYCSNCGIRISEICSSCSSIINSHDKYCSNCGNKN